MYTHGAAPQPTSPHPWGRRTPTATALRYSPPTAKETADPDRGRTVDYMRTSLLVREHLLASGQSVGDFPSTPTAVLAKAWRAFLSGGPFCVERAWDLAEARVPGLVEATERAAAAMRSGHLGELNRALATTAIAAYSLSWAFGVDADLMVDEVHRANMSKLGDGTKPIYRDDGKVLKGTRFTPPDARAALRRHASSPPTLLSPRPLVAEFHRVYGLAQANAPVVVLDPNLVELRCRLQDEELTEVRTALHYVDLANLLCELADVLYIAYGSAVCFGIDPDRDVPGLLSTPARSAA